MGDPVLDEIEHLADRPAGWDSYGAPAIERGVVEHVRRCLLELRDRLGAAYRDPVVGPDVDGGVELIWTTADGSNAIHALIRSTDRFKILVVSGGQLRSDPAKSVDDLAGILRNYLRS